MYAARLIALTMALLTMGTMPARAEFVPDPSRPPVVTQGTGTR
jgi:hypothetical protein